MSDQAIGNDKTGAQTKKTITLNAYADPSVVDGAHFDGTETDEEIEEIARTFATVLSEDRDFFETTTREETDKYLALDGQRFDLDWESEDELEQLVADGANLGDFEFVTKTSSTTEYRHGPVSAGRELREEFVADLDVPPGLTQRWDRRFEDAETGETMIRFSGYEATPRRRLVHQSERTPATRFEDDDPTARQMAVQWIITLGPASEAQIEQWSTSVVGAFSTFVARQHGIETVRIADCTETLEREGDCFDL